MFIKNEYTNFHEESCKESVSVQNNNLENNADNSPEFVSIKCEIEFDVSSSIKEEPLSDDEGSYIENVKSSHLFSQDQQNISLLESSNFTSTIRNKETSKSPFNNDLKEIEITIAPITQKISLNQTYSQGCILCQRKNVLGTKQTKNKDDTKCNCQVYRHLSFHMFNRESKQTVSFMEKDCSIKKQYWCDICKKRFQCRSTIIRHMQVHNENKRYSCKICDKKFSCAGLIKPHMRSHTGEKPYICLICKNRFSHKCNMQRHMERHKKVKNLKCPVCGKIFPMESRLKYHMRTHTNEKPFKCGICKKVFSHKQNVQRHYSSKHPMDKFNCTETDASVARMVWDKIVNKVVELLPN